ncbi:MAG: SDR family oxidoreductase [Bdellovibrionales bacterium]|nr:SDR family oxidoreductase [Bdellovibrionales bacterium]
MTSTPSISIKKSFANKNILLIGGTGFLGKTWLLMLIDKVQTMNKVYVLLRKKGSQSARVRFEKMINESYLFKHLHEKDAQAFHEFLQTKVEVLEGDSTVKNFGLSKIDYDHLLEQVDLLVNCAGLVDFHPDLRDALWTNIYATMECASFAKQSKKSKLLHVSTCYTAGVKEGLIKEEIDPDHSPTGQILDPEMELQWMKAAIEREEKKVAQLSVDEILDQLPFREEKREQFLSQESHDQKKTLEVYRNKILRQQLIGVGRNRAKMFSWTNTYTYTKALAEKLLVSRFPDLDWAVFRPSIIESTHSYPFAGWNEGFNTSGPLTYLASTWFRHVPAKRGNPFDVIPVDFVCRGIMVSAAQLLLGQAKRVYQCGSSDQNRFTIDRATELTSLSHRLYYERSGKKDIKTKILSRFETVPVAKDSMYSLNHIYNVLSFFQKGTNWLYKRIPTWIQKPLRPAKNTQEKWTRRFEKITGVVNLFAPFTHDYFQIFQTKNLMEVQVEEKDLNFDPMSIEWRHYWMEVQMPALRTWSFPVIEGKEKQLYQPKTPFSFETEKKIPYRNYGLDSTVPSQSAAR